MAAKKTRGKSQLGKGRWSAAEHARQVRQSWKGGGGGPTWAVSDMMDPDEDIRDRKEQKKRSGPTTRWSKARIAAANAARASGDSSKTPGEKALPRGGGRAKASAARAAATRKKNIAASKKAGTYARTAKNQTERNKARARSDARTRVGGGSPGSRVAGGLARLKGR